MPQIVFKATWFFQAGRGYGWTENFYGQAVDLPSAQALVTTPFIAARVGMLTSPYLLTAIRFTNVTPPAAGQAQPLRQSLVTSIPAAQGIGTMPGPTNATAPPPTNIGGQWVGGGDWGPGGGQAEPGEPFQALLIRMEAGVQNRRSLLIRGIPDSITDASADYTPTAAWNTAFNTWKAFYIRQNTAWGVRTVGGGALTLPNAVNVIQNGAVVQVVFPAALDPVWPNNQLVKISNVLGASYLKGYWRTQGAGVASGIAPANVMTYQMRIKKRLITGTPAIVPRVLTVNPGFASFSAFIPERGVKKSTGRPSGVSRGRARVQTA